MADVVVSEFMDEAALARFAPRYTVHVGTTLWNEPAALGRALTDAVALIVRNRTQVTADVLAAARRLRVVGRLGVGLDNIDMSACAARGIAVHAAVGANAVSVAEYVVGSAIVLGRRSAFLDATAALMAGRWPREAAGAGSEIGGRRIGIIGFGNIGQTVGRYAAALGMAVSAHDDLLPAADPAWNGVSRSSLDALLATADVVSLHCPLTPTTRGMINAERVSRMKKGAILINAARGGVVVEAAVAAALRSGRLSGAALDVFEREPIDETTARLFSGLTNVILTPHVAGVTAQSNDRISALTVANVLGVLERAA
jgi:(S)-sulfolactate dehydrogenase